MGKKTTVDTNDTVLKKMLAENKRLFSIYDTINIIEPDFMTMNIPDSDKKALSKDSLTDVISFYRDRIYYNLLKILKY